MPEQQRRRHTPESAAFYAALAAEMRAALGRARIQQKDIASKLGYRQNWLSKRFSGDVPWGLDELVAVSEYLSANGPVKVHWAEVVDAAGRNARHQAADHDASAGDANDVAK